MSSRTFVITVVSVALALVAWELRWVLLVFFGAVVLGVALDVPMTLLRRFVPLSRPLALLVVLAALVISGWQVGQLLLPEVIEQINTLQQLLPQLVQRLVSLAGQWQGLGSLQQQLEGLLTWDRLQPLGGQVLGLAGGAANTVVQLLLMVLLALLMALDPRSHQRLLISATPQVYRGGMQALLQECREALGGWLAGMTLSALAVFLLTWLGLAMLGVPLALLSGLVCGLLTFVPTIGPTAATLLPLAVALLISPAKLIQVLLLRLVLQNLEAFVLTPMLLKRTVNLLPTVALMAQLSLGAVLGLPGLLLALPLVVVLQVVAERVLVAEVMDRWQSRSAER